MMRRKFRTVKQHYFLYAIAATQIALGVSYIDPAGVTPGREMAFSALPLEPWAPGVILLFSGGFALTAAILQSRAIYKYAFPIAIIPYSLLASTFFLATLLGSHPSGWATGINYIGLAIFVWLAAGVVDWPRNYEDFISAKVDRRADGASAADNLSTSD